jgi:hypothetical protein
MLMNTMNIRGSIVGVAIGLALFALFFLLFSEIKSASPQAQSVKPDNHWAKVDHQLSTLYEEYQLYLERGGFEVLGQFKSRNRLLSVTNDTVAVDLVASDDPDLLLQDLKGLGIEKRAVVGRVISVRLPITAIEALPHLDSLRFARPAYARTN